MNSRGWYQADAMMSALTTHSHSMIGSSDDEIERRIKDLYPDAVIVFAYRQESTKPSREAQR